MAVIAKGVSMFKKTLILLLGSYVYCACQGCTYNVWYKGFQDQQRQECYEQMGEDEIQRCLDQVNTMTYEQYLESRKQTKTTDFKNKF